MRHIYFLLIAVSLFGQINLKNQGKQSYTPPATYPNAGAFDGTKYSVFKFGLGAAFPDALQGPDTVGVHIVTNTIPAGAGAVGGTSPPSTASDAIQGFSQTFDNRVGAVGGYFNSYCSATGTGIPYGSHCWGAVGAATQPPTGGGANDVMFAFEGDINIKRNDALQAAGVWLAGASAFQTTGASVGFWLGFLGVPTQIPWKFAMKTENGSAINGISLGALQTGVNKFSQAISFHGLGPAAQDNAASIRVNQLGEMLIQSDAGGKIFIADAGSNGIWHVSQNGVMGVKVFAIGSLPAVETGGVILVSGALRNSAPCSAGANTVLASSDGVSWNCMQ